MSISKPRLSDKVALDLQKLILSQYKAGDRLPTENELSQMFSVSRVTVREAIKKLITMEVVDVRQGEGTFVKKLTPASFMRPILPMLSLTGSDFSEIFEVRLIIESSTVELAIKNASNEEIDAIKDILNKAEDAALAGNLEQYNEYDVLFHNQIARCSHNHLLAIINELISDIIKESLLLSNKDPAHMLASVSYHRRIYDALSNRNSDLAVILMKEHLSGGLDFCLGKKSEANHGTNTI